jgi:hypothetical protein
MIPPPAVAAALARPLLLLSLASPPSCLPPLAPQVAEKAAAQALVRFTAGIDRCYVIEGQRGEPTKVQTDGINFQVGGPARCAMPAQAQAALAAQPASWL